MAKTANVFARVEPEVKEQAEEILSLLGISLSAAFGMFLKQVILQNGLPFNVKLPPHNAEMYPMSKRDFDLSMQRAYEQMERGEGIPSEKLKEELTQAYGIEL